MRRFLRTQFLCTLLAVALPLAWAAAADAVLPQNAPTYECRWTEGPITLDGRADEPAWKNAQVIDNFRLPWLGADERAAKTATRARLLWDREYLYFFADMEDHDVFADVKKHNGPTWDNDVFELFFKPADDKPGYYEFEINAINTVFDVFIAQRGSTLAGPYLNKNKFHVESNVTVRGTVNERKDRDEGWSIEGRIPWSDFVHTGGRPKPDELWKFALCRYDYTLDAKEPELSTCAPMKGPRGPNFHFFEGYAKLQFLGPPAVAAERPFGAAERPYGIDKLEPFTTSRVVGTPDPPPPYRVKVAYPKLKTPYPVIVRSEPKTRRLYYLLEDAPYGATTLWRTRDDPASGEAEKLMRQNAVAYDLAFHPDYEHNGYLYIGLNEPHTPRAKRFDRIIRYTVSRTAPFALDPASAQTIIEWPSDGHNGSAVAFGLDGMLYVTSGDGTSDSDQNIVGQDLDKLTCKVLRIDVDHPDAGRNYSVPKDNPFVGRVGTRPETWAYGLRNPWRITVDAKTGHVWVGNNGQDLWEQAYLIQRGANYGWSIVEGSHPFYQTRKRGPEPISLPTVEHGHNAFRSLTGGVVYYGSKFPDLQGAYIYGDYSTGKIWGIRHDGQKAIWHRELATTTLSIVGFGTDADGELLICDLHGTNESHLYTLEPSPPGPKVSNFPRLLSQSGLFRSVRDHAMQPGVIPYEVNSPLWSDGAYKQRYMAVPGDNPKIDVTPTRGWGFPEGTVLVKSFALETEEGNHATRKWIETRFMTVYLGDWVGYSYRWNDEQTDATLVEAPGQDQQFTIRVPKSEEHPDGVRQQVWHYPSRAECLVCHSRAAHMVLGITTNQLNCDHDYGGVRDNQLRTLEHLGILRVNNADLCQDWLQKEARDLKLSDSGREQYVKDHTLADQRQAVPSPLLSAAPEKLPRLVNPYNAAAPLNARARSYLHSNCYHCHVPSGGGNAQFDVEVDTALADTKLLDVLPQHHTFGIDGAKLIVPGEPDRSVLISRVTRRGAGQMPPLASSVVDEPAVALLRAWISEMPKKVSAK
ncbi:MAG: PQQ-dependent sugar dehydrogenase [Planctomycetia bacterium]|nr:PQQ-dependent sugar dehydrogenase [Planctomycetia bacterium]